MAERAFEALAESLDELRCEMGDDLAKWSNRQGNPRLGYARSVEFLSGGDDREEATAWLRERLERLVSTLRPRIRRLVEEPA